MEREYIAFISYRHKPLDMAVAKQVHREIEHYTVPREYRKNGQKRIGLVFRDQDELPLSSDLSGSIQEALKHSRFLIVICTPDLSQSKWCMEEIDTFIALHGHERVLAVLASGTPETSFPPQLLHLSDAGGNVIRDIEPLAANVASETAGKALRKLKSESLRLIAAMLGCPYDALRQREKRYRQQRATIALAAGLAVAAAFLGMLIWKNAQVQAQYVQAQENLRMAQLKESQALTETARQQWNAGLRIDALHSLLEALPDGKSEDRPYEKGAERILAEVLNAYGEKNLRCISNLSQPSDIRVYCASFDGTAVFTLDDYGSVRAFDISSGKKRWQIDPVSAGAVDSSAQLLWCEKQNAVLFADKSRVILLSAENGQTLWRVYFGEAPDPQPYFTGQEVNVPWQSLPAVYHLKAECVSDGQYIVLAASWWESGACLYWIDSSDGSVSHAVQCPESAGGMYFMNLAVSQDGRYAACTSNSSDTYELLAADSRSGTCFCRAQTDTDSQYRYEEIVFSAENTLVYAWMRGDLTADRPVHIFLLDPDTGEEKQTVSCQLPMTDHSPLDAWMYLKCTDKYLLYAFTRDFYVFSRETGELLHRATLPGEIMSVCQIGSNAKNETLMFALKSGIITYVLVYEDEIAIMYDWNTFHSMNFLLSSASFTLDHSRLTLSIVPRQRENELLILKFSGAKPIRYLTDTEVSARCMTLSPSRTKIFRCDWSGYSVVSSGDGSVLYQSSPNSVPYVDYDSAALPVFTSDEKAVIFGKYKFDLETGSVGPLSLPDSESVSVISSCWIPGQEAAFSVSPMTAYSSEANSFISTSVALYRDGEAIQTIPLPSGQWTERFGKEPDSFLGTYKNVFRTGSSGLLVMTLEDDPSESAVRRIAIYDIPSEKWSFIEYERGLSGQFLAAVANAHKWVALLEPDARLSVWDAEQGKRLWEYPLEYAATQIEGLFFSPEDEILAVELDKQMVVLLRTDTGTALETVDLSSEINGYSNGEGLSMQTDEEKERLWIYTQDRAEGSRGLCIDMRDGTTLQAVESLCFVDPDQGYLYRYDSLEKAIAVYPCYDLNDLLEMGNKMLETN